jgi:osmoprotectant transport system ATP-binding protein
MSESPAVELRQVSKVYANGIRAVDDVSLTVAAGRIVALLGASGCGKTTTLRLINRLEEATAGTIHVRGQDVRGQRPELLRRSIGYVIQEDSLLPHRDVASNVALVPRLLGWPRQRVRRRVAEVLELVGLSEAQFGRRMPAELSGGQRQRVGVARALAADPDLLLMDEPFSALDPGTREGLQDEFLRLHHHLGKTVVIVTHDVAEAGRLAGEIVLLDRGRIVQRGTLRDLLIRPADARVRAFLGRRGPDLALDVLQLRHLLDEVPPAAARADALPLSAELSFGQALASLAAAPEDAVVAVSGEPVRHYAARTLRERIAADVAAAGEGRNGILS